jgi:hypothetical protein
MRRPWWLVFILIGLIAAAPADSPDADDLEHNRKLLDKWWTDAEHQQRLVCDLHAYCALPADHQERIRTFDRELNELPKDKRDRLWKVLVRYSAWLDTLPKEERDTLLKLDTKERLARIRELRQKEWLARLPDKKRDELLALQEKNAGKFVDAVKQLKKEERDLRKMWVRAVPPPQAFNPKPKTLSEFTPEVQEYVKKHLLPRLKGSETDELRKAEGIWPDYARLIKQFDSNHPMLISLRSGPITKWDDLPEEVKKTLGQDGKKQLEQEKQDWPDYAEAVTKLYARRTQTTPPALGACKLEDFPDKIQTYIRDQLMPILPPLEENRLRDLQNKRQWREYQNRLRFLARKYQKVIPGMSLPGPPEVWANIR